jgi:hypothetical protein
VYGGNYSRFGSRLLIALHAPGLRQGPAQETDEPSADYYVIAIVGLKCWALCAYMSQSFYGISHGVAGGADTQKFVFVMVSQGVIRSD